MLLKRLLLLTLLLFFGNIFVFAQTDFNLVGKDSVMSGEYTFNNVSLTKNASITVAAYNATTKKGGALVIKANTIVIEAGSFISATAKGGGGLSTPGYGGGAGYGGPGGSFYYVASTGGQIYGDSLENYVYMGSNGGKTGFQGGVGGGSITLVCSTLVVHGKILTDGGDAGSFGYYDDAPGGGSGGGILINCKNIFFDGTITANGGKGGDAGGGMRSGGGGGGGRIKIFAVSKTLLGVFSVKGAWGVNNGQDGTMKFDSYPTTPILLTPINYTNLSKPTFLMITSDAEIWNNMNYKIEISKDSFKTIYSSFDQRFNPIGWSKLNYTTNDTAVFTIQDVLPDGKYQWRAYAYDGSVWSDGWNWNAPYPTTFNEFIVGATYISLSSPIGSEAWQAGTQKTINWSSGKVTNVKIEYTTDAGSTWTTIIGSYPASSSKFYWNIPASINSQQCLIKVSSTASSSVYGISANTFSILPGWQANLNIRDAGSSTAQGTLVFGVAPDATDGLDYQYGEAPLPPTPPSGVFDSRFDMPGPPAVSSAVDFRNASLKNVTWNLRFQASTSGYPITFSWDVASLPIGNFFLRDVINGTIINVDMKSQNSYTLTNSGITSLKIDYTRASCNTYSYSSGWGLYSVPVIADNMAANAIFPQAASPVYEFSNTAGYFAQTVLTTGKGYWVSMGTQTQQTLCGGYVVGYNVPVKAGWNIIGVYSNPVTVSAITTQGTTVSSPFYSYSSGYVNASTLQSSLGYWVKVTTDGNLVLPTALAKGEAITEIKYDNKWGRLIFTDNARNSSTLYSAPTGVSVASFEMPPLPPNGIFDVRYSSQKNVEVLSGSEKEITISGGAYPVVIRAEGSSFTIKDKATNGAILSKLVQNGGTLTIANQGINQLIIQGSTAPVAFELLQNYPNPFNPKTRISFSLPERTRAELAVYNTLGEKVAELVNELKEPGFYNVDWNAEHFSSGIYFYQLKTEKQSIVKKLILMK